MTSNKKEEQLGMSIGKASNILKKNIMFNLARKCGMLNCYRCGKEIDTVNEISVEHKVPWLDSNNPDKLFFDIDNIAFSHHKCNCKYVRRGVTKRKSGNAILRNISSSGCLYVYYHPTKSKNRWQAKPYIDGKCVHKGYYDTKEEAAQVVDVALIENVGNNVETNKSLGLI